jgi:type I restriction enzyme S subunit
MPRDEERYAIRSGDLLVIAGHANPMEIGRCAAVGAEAQGLLHQNHVFRLRGSYLLPKLAEDLLNSAAARAYWLARTGTSSGLYTISRRALLELRLPLIPPVEQRSIVEVLDAVTQAQHAAQAEIEKLQMVQEGMSKDLLRPGDSWRSLRICDLGEVVTGTTPPSDWDARRGEKSIPLITPTEISRQGEIVGSSRLIGAVHEEGVRKISKMSTMAVCVGFGVGKVALGEVECCTNQQINSVIPRSGMDPRFVYLAIADSMRRAKASAGLQVTPIINKTDFSSLAVYAPDIGEQRKVADQIWSVRRAQAQLMDEIGKLRLLRRGIAGDLLTGRMRLGEVA